MVRPPRIELGPRVPETLVISFSLRARSNNSKLKRQKFLITRSLSSQRVRVRPLALS
jgi:hypothetical protein